MTRVAYTIFGMQPPLDYAGHEVVAWGVPPTSEPDVRLPRHRAKRERDVRKKREEFDGAGQR